MTNNKLVKLSLLGAICVCLFPVIAFSQSGNDAEEISKICAAPSPRYPSECKERERLTAYQPNYVIWQDTDDDEESLEALYSFRYLITNPDCMSGYRDEQISDKKTLACLKSFNARSEFYLSYTGKFDFYADTRTSGPVINRLSNPALHYRKYFDNKILFRGMSLRFINVALEHRSNGQVVLANEKISDPSSVDYGRYRAQVEYENGNHEYFDGIRRGADYISLEGQFQLGKYYDKDKNECKKTAKCFSLRINVIPTYLDHDSNITWGPLANKGIEISDYDIVKTTLSNTFFTPLTWPKEAEISGEWTIGGKGTDTDSFDINIFLPIDLKNGTRIPFLYMRYHNGPMSTLSNYTEKQDSFGVGMRLQ